MVYGAPQTGIRQSRDLAISCAKVVIDATGLGAAPVAYLQRAFGELRVEPVVSTPWCA
jgi:hypothetical protein